MKNFKTLILFMILLTPMLMIAQGDPADPVEAGTIVEWLTPFIVLASTWVVRTFKPSIPGWMTMIVVSGLSAAVAWVTNITIGGDMSFFTQTLLGLLAVFINQTYRQFTGGNSASKKA